MKHIKLFEAFVNGLNESSNKWAKETVRSKWFETGEGTAYFIKDKLIGFVYQLEGKWIALGGLDGDDVRQVIKDLETGKIGPEEGWSASLDTFEDAEKELTSNNESLEERNKASMIGIADLEEGDHNKKDVIKQ